jgi:phage terminase large subunit-like protein
VDLPDGWEGWPVEAKQKFLATLRAATEDRARSPWYCNRRRCDGEPHGRWNAATLPESEGRHARTEQRPPDGDWETWLVLAGRGFGKTRSEWTCRRAKKIPYGVIVAPTAGDLRDTMIEGESGILTVAPRLFRPKYEPSKRRLTWPNGHTTACLSAEEPDRIRGPNAGYAWGDEWAMWKHMSDATDNLELTLRLKGPWSPQLLLTTTPKPRKALRAQVKDEGTVVTRGSTYDNVQNLAEVFKRKIIRKYEGTTVGAQELHAELLDDVMGALWNGEVLSGVRVDLVPLVAAKELAKIVVAVDPAVTANEGSDETGIVVVGKTWPNHCPACGPIADGPHSITLDDLSGRYSPNAWATLAVNAYHRYEADAIIGEVNNGGDLVGNTVHTIDPRVRYRDVRASRGKATRAEPVAALAEQNRDHNVRGLMLLEEQMRTWVPGESPEDSPDRVDAKVWGTTDLMLGETGQALVAAG